MENNKCTLHSLDPIISNTNVLDFGYKKNYAQMTFCQNATEL